MRDSKHRHTLQGFATMNAYKVSDRQGLSCQEQAQESTIISDMSPRPQRGHRVLTLHVVPDVTLMTGLRSKVSTLHTLSGCVLPTFRGYRSRCGCTHLYHFCATDLTIGRCTAQPGPSFDGGTSYLLRVQSYRRYFQLVISIRVL